MNSHLTLPSNRKFGFFFSSIFLLGAIFLQLKDVVLWSFACSVLSIAFFSASLIKPDSLLILNRIWMKLGLLLGAVVSPLVLGMIFFLIFTPSAVIMRIFGRDELRLRLRQRSSFWLPRTMPIEAESFKHQF